MGVGGGDSRGRGVALSLVHARTRPVAPFMVDVRYKKAPVLLLLVAVVVHVTY